MDKIITDVAIYLRKSRGEEEDLAKHKIELVDIAERNQWKYTIYQEIGSAENIEYREKMKELLKDVSADLFDAVLVVDFDRLGRGDMKDQATIKDVFTKSDTLIITPQKVHDLRNETDDLLTDFLGIIARMEYKAIKKRFKRGKKIGAKLGNWTNGKPPFPYVYIAETKRVVVDEEKRSLYLHIKERVLKGEALQSIASDLNRNGYRTNKGSVWSPNAVLRIVSNEFHLGRTIFGKSKGSGHKHKKTEPLEFLPRSEWTIVEGTHEALMTEEEFAQIQATLERNKLIKVAARKGTYILSGLVKCYKCGYARTFNRKVYGGKEHIFVKTCQHADAFGNRCNNSGLDADIILDVLKRELQSRAQKLTERSDERHEGSEKERLTLLLEKREQELKKVQGSLERIRDSYELGDYTREEFLERRQQRQNEIKELTQQIENIRSKIDYYENQAAEDTIEAITNVLALFDHGTPKEINLALKKIIASIHTGRDEEGAAVVEIRYI